MRVDTLPFVAKNLARVKRPRYVVEVAFDSANAVLWYFTSHTDSALPPGAQAILQVLESLTGTSQALNPDTANASIGSISFKLVDRARVVTQTLGGQLALGRSTRRQRVRIYVGYEGLAWADYTLIQTQLVTEITYDKGAYNFSCADVQREMRKELFDGARATLAGSITATDTVIPVSSTAGFEVVAHGSTYGDAPGQSVGYIRVQDEIIRWVSKNATSFVCTADGRGALGTRAAEHVSDATTSADRRTEVEEYFYLELPAVDLMYRLLTGKDRLGNAVLPTKWHLGIPTSYVHLIDFTTIGADLWDPAANSGFVVRLEDLDKTDGKKFIETELALLCGLFMPVYANGALGLQRMANVLAGAAYDEMLDETNLVGVGELKHDFDALHNVITVSWNWEPLHEKYTRVNTLVDAASEAIHKRADPLHIKFKGLHGSRHSFVVLMQRFDALRDRYTAPPLRLRVQTVPSLNAIEVGDIVRVRAPGVRDFNEIGIADYDLDRSFEVQRVSMDWVKGIMNLDLFASSRAPGELPATTESITLPNAWYSSVGTPLSSVVTITGANPGHVTAGGTLTGVPGDANAAGSIYYYEGDLVVDPGVTINVVNTPQLRVRGFFQNQGTFNGKANGHAGAAALPSYEYPAVPATAPAPYNPGIAARGKTQAGGGLHTVGAAPFRAISTPAPTLPGSGSVLEKPSNGGGTVPSSNLTWDGVTLGGLPADLRGTSGSSGMMLQDGNAPFVSYYAGGAGGNGGSGVIIVCRGFAQGVAGKIDLSGGDGSAAVERIFGGVAVYRPGSGAGGAPGSLLVVLDGASAIATDLTEAKVICRQGKTPVVRPPLPSPNEPGPMTKGPTETAIWYSYYVGTGDGITGHGGGEPFPMPDRSGIVRGGARVQYVPTNEQPVADQPPARLKPPSLLDLQSGTAQILKQVDGTIVPRILATWVPSPDGRTVGYEIQFKPSSEAVWSTAPLVLGPLSSSAFITNNVTDGREYDVRIRAVGDVRFESDFVTKTNHFVIGKTADPSDVTVFTIEGNRLSWVNVPDEDVIGYRIKFQPGNSKSWGDAVPVHEGEVVNNPHDMKVRPLGFATLMIKAVDFSKNESANAAYIFQNYGDPDIDNLVETFDREAAGFPGVKVGCAVSAGDLVADAITPLMWKDDAAAMWATDANTLMWGATQWSAMSYVETLSLSDVLPGTFLVIEINAGGDPWRLEYRENSHAPMWSGDDAAPMWSGDDSALMWDDPPFWPWPGQIEVRDSLYEIRFTAGQSSITRGTIGTLVFMLDAPDVVEEFDDFLVAAGGTRLPLTKSFAAIKNIRHTVQADGGTAVRARTEDKNVNLGPLIKCYDSAGTSVSGTLDITVKGY